MSKRKKLIVALSISIILIIFLASFLSHIYVVPILMYHSVNPDARRDNLLAVGAVAFERQMHFLKTHRYNVLPLEELAGLIRNKKKIPARTLAITFDDGYKDNYTYALPILKKYNLPATIFITVNEVGRPGNDRLSWDEIREMEASEIISFGSHTLSHPYLPLVSSDEELKKQIFDSKKILEKKLDREVNSFCYPIGGFNPKIKQLVKDAGYKVAVATNPRGKNTADDIFALKRLRISATSDNLFIFWAETNGYYSFLQEHRHK